MDNTNILLTIRARDGIVYEGKVQSVTSVNETGKFDILPEHANFISLIKDTVVIKDIQGSMKKIKIDVGLLRTRQNKVEIYLGIDSSSTSRNSLL